MKEHSMIKLPLALAMVCLVSGCATSLTPNYDARFGDAVREARQRMTINPAAGTVAGPVAGMDGRAGTEAVQRYHDSFKAPPPVVNVINIGGSGSAR
jgi:hypothetical protein